MVLERLEAYGVFGTETIVMDDGSELPAPQSLMTRFRWVRFERSAFSMGYIVQRNRLATLLSTPFYLSLDDDSFPLAGDLGQAAHWLQTRDDAVALAFPILERACETDLLHMRSTPPYPVRHFIGCAHLLKRELFLKLGGYQECFEYYCEEPEFTARAWRHSYTVYCYPSVIVKHSKSPVQRNQARSVRFGVRNTLWIKAMHYPLPLFLLNILTILPRTWRRSRLCREEPWAALKGFLQALIGLHCAWKQREALSFSQLLAIRKRPLPIVR